MSYSQKVFEFINVYREHISEVANKLEISQEAIAGAIVEKYDSQNIKDFFQEGVVKKYSHDEILFANICRFGFLYV